MPINLYTIHGTLDVVDTTYLSNLSGSQIFTGYFNVTDNLYTADASGIAIGDTTSLFDTGPFSQNQILREGDLELHLWDTTAIDGTYNPRRFTPIWTNFSLKKFDSSSDSTGILSGYKYRTPVNPSVGDFYVSAKAPEDVARHQIRWLYQKDSSSLVTSRTQGFNVESRGIDATIIY